MGLEPFVTIRNWFVQTYQRFSMVPFIFILIALEIYFFINGKAHFPDWDDSYGQLIQVYLIMTILFLVWAGRKTQEQLRRPLKNSTIAFVMFFILTYIFLLILSAIGAITTAPPIEPGLFWPTVIVQICVVATAEELMFRGVVLEMVGVIPSAIAFAIFHIWAYQIVLYELDWATMNWGAIVFALIMGLILALIAKRKEWGLPAVIAVHSAYNLFVVGAFYSFTTI